MHPEFEGKTIHFAAFDRNGNEMIGTEPKDFGKHGTHVSAGLVAGKNAGVAPKATLAVAAVLPSDRGTEGNLAQILAGLDWLITAQFGDDPDNPGVHVINASIEVKPGEV